MSTVAPRAYRSLVVLVTTLAMACVLVGPSEAAPRRWSKLAVSTDGRHWQKTLRQPLFDRRMQWVPGDTEIRSFYVRNRSHEPARMSLRVTINDRARLLRTGQLRFYVKPGGKWVRITKARGAWRFKVKVRPGVARRVWVKVQMHPRAANWTMHKTEPFTLRVRLTSMRRH